MADVDSVVWKRGELDGWVWDKETVYNVRSGYNALAYKGIQRSVNIFEELWRMKVLIDRVPTRANLSRRDVQLTTTQYPMCNLHAESTQYLFLNCLVTSKVWASCDRWT